MELTITDITWGVVSLSKSFNGAFLGSAHSCRVVHAAVGICEVVFVPIAAPGEVVVDAAASAGFGDVGGGIYGADEEAHGAAQNIGGTLNQVYKRDIQKIVN